MVKYMKNNKKVKNLLNKQINATVGFSPILLINVVVNLKGQIIFKKNLVPTQIKGYVKIFNI